MIIMAFMAAAVMSAISCNKETVDNPSNDRLVSFSFDAPVIAEESTVSPQSKVYIYNSTDNFSSTTTRPTFRWENGDKITILSHDLPDTWADAQYTVWGQYTAQSTAPNPQFKGYLPTSYQTDAYLILHSKMNDSFTIKSTGTKGRFDIKYNIPSEQDGTGVKYCLFGAKPASYDATNKAFTFAAINDIRTNNSSVSAYNNQFALKNALVCFNVPASANVTQIKITVSASNGTTLYMTSQGNAQDITCASNTWAHSGGGCSYVNISNGGAVLSGDIFFASRQIEGKKDTYYPILTFEFTNVAGLKATKTVNVATGINSATSFTAKNILVSYLTKLGSVTFNEGDFQ